MLVCFWVNPATIISVIQLVWLIKRMNLKNLIFLLVIVTFELISLDLLILHGKLV